MHFECDKEGLKYITSQGERKTYWDNYQAIRVFKYTMVFIPKDQKGMYLLAPIENLQNVTAFLEENSISSEDKAIELAKKAYGSSSDVYFRIEQIQSNGVYIVSVRDNETTKDLAWYTVNVNNGTVK